MGNGLDVRRLACTREDFGWWAETRSFVEGTVAYIRGIAVKVQESLQRRLYLGACLACASILIAQGPGLASTAAQARTTSPHGNAVVGRARTGFTPPPQPPQQGAAALTPAAMGSGKGLKIGYISNKEDVPIVHVISLGIEAQAARAGAKLYVCDSAGSDAKALSCAQSFASQGVQGIVNFQHDATAAPAICRAGPKVPVIAVDISQKPCQTSFMGVDNAYGGYIAGLALGYHFKQSFGCKYDAWISLEEPEIGATNSDRLGGYRKGFAQYCGAVRNLKVEAFDASAQQAHKIITNVLGSLPGAHHIIVASIDDEGIEGAFAAAGQQGRANDLYAAALGMADNTARCGIKTNPNWVSDTAIFPDKYGQVAIPGIIRAIKGQQIPPHLYMPLRAVTGSTISTYYPNLHC